MKIKKIYSVPTLIANHKKIMIVIGVFAALLGGYRFFLFQKSLIREVKMKDQKDFPAYFLAAKIAEQEKNFYSLEVIKKEAESHSVTFVDYRANLYPPPFSMIATVFMPKNLFQAQESYVRWKLFLVFLLAVSFPFYLVRKSSIGTESKLPLGIFICGMTILAFSFIQPLEADFKDGQINIVVSVLLMAVFLFAEKYPGISGAFAALGGAIKISPYFVSLYFLMRKNIRYFLMLGGTTILLFSISTVLFGLETLFFYLKNIFIPFFSSDHIPILNWPLAHSQNQSIRGLLSRLFITNYTDQYSGTAILIHAPGTAKFLISAINFSVIGFCGYLAWRIPVRTKKIWPRPLVFGFFTSAMLITSPLTWFHHLATVTIPVSILITYFCMKIEVKLSHLIVFGIVLLGLSLPPLFLFQGTRARGYSFLNYIKLFALLILMAQTAWLFFKELREENENE